MSYPPTVAPGLPNTLGDIITKVRLITKSPSPNMISDDQIVQYINTWYLYDMPQELRLKNCLSNYSFATIPMQETYKLPTDTIITIEPPVYINGYQSLFTQSQDNFYMLYPRLGISFTGPSGTSITGPYTFTLQLPGGIPPGGVLQGNTVVSAIDNATGLGIATGTDTPTNTTTGTFQGNGMAAASTINYTTGVITLNFANILPTTATIHVQFVPYVPSRPVAMLFYADVIHLRPIPDAAYLVNIQAYINPIAAITGALYNPPIGQTYTPALGAGPNDTVLSSPPNPYTTLGANPIARGFVSSTDTPQLKQWWQLAAWGAALKLLEDRGDWDTVERLYPFYDKQMRLVLRRTIVEQNNERTATIYTEQTQGIGNSWYNQR